MKALLIIDVQKSYMAKYQTDLLERINRQIDDALKNLYDIVYIKNTKVLRRGNVTEEFADELNRVSRKALRGVRNGFDVSFVLSCTGIANPTLFVKTKEELEKIGVRFI